MWKPIKKLEGKFLISDSGEVKNAKTGTTLKLQTNKKGYKVISVKPNGESGKQVGLRVHRAVAEEFLPPPTSDQLKWAESTYYKLVEVNHKDGDKTNNHVSNLEWATGSENMKHAIREKLQTPLLSKDHGTSKLTESQVQEIRARYKPHCKINGGPALGREFKVTRSQISRVARGESFKHMTMPD